MTSNVDYTKILNLYSKAFTDQARGVVNSLTIHTPSWEKMKDDAWLKLVTIGEINIYK